MKRYFLRQNHVWVEKHAVIKTNGTWETVSCPHTTTHINRTEPTCTKQGEEQVVCSECGEIISTSIIPELGHDYSIEEIVPPTETEQGYTRHTCSRCGHYYDDTFVDPKPAKVYLTVHCVTDYSSVGGANVQINNVNVGYVSGDTTDTFECNKGDTYYVEGEGGNGTTAEGIIENDLEITVYEGECFIKGTLITLADMSTKSVEDITYNDNLLVWDFDRGYFTTAKPSVILKPGVAPKYNHLVFSDGSHLDTVNQHRIFNKEKGMFTYPMTKDTPIGTTTFNDHGEEITLVSKEVINEPVEYYNIITENHFNLFANTILTSCRLNNLYPIKDMKFIKDNREIKPKEVFPNLTDYEYQVFRAGEQLEDINKNSDDHGDKSVEDYIVRCRNNAK